MIVTARYLFVVGIFISLLSCSSDKSEKKFRIVPSSESGVTFRNDINPTLDFNIFNYMYFYNGGGVATGDLNGDGLADIYFTANQGPNKLYLNKGGMKFADVTDKSGAVGLTGWATGVTMADVNGDNRLDVYVSYLGNHLNYQGRNLLLINTGNDSEGVPQFQDKTVEYGLDLVGFSTQAAFFDYDLDGDLDMYMLNHSIHKNGTFGKSYLRFETHPLAGDKLMRNDGNHFTDVTKEAGIYSSVIGYGLGLVVSDVNLDGWPDIYVGNDFHENDYLYINQGNGKFKESLEKSMRHTSHFAMGCDFVDFNNDVFPDLISMDMLPANPRILKASAAEDPYDLYQFKLNYGYNYQYARNTFQLNQHNGTFSEIGLFAGVYATDWSWSALGADLDLDGFKDIFIANGIERRSNDLDYINFITIDSIQSQIQFDMREKELEYYKKMPQVKIPNFVFMNNGDSTFSNEAVEWGLDKASYSHGAAYADFDNDGDLDLVTNNAADEAFIYENLHITNSQKKDSKVNYVKFTLVGNNGNTAGLGAKVFVYNQGKTQMQECMGTRGFQSCVDTRLIFGVGASTAIDSVIVVWPDKTFQKLTNVTANSNLTFKKEDAKGVFNYARFHEQPQYITFIEDNLGIDFKHKENKFVEFNREPLIPHMVSAEGPACAIADWDGDGLEDIFLGNGKWAESAIYIQQKNGTFRKGTPEKIASDSLFEDVDATFFDADQDGDNDLLVVSGGNEWAFDSPNLQSRIYFNDKGKVSKSVLLEPFGNGSVARPGDFDNDGDIDLFFGLRSVPWKYGIIPDSYLLENDGKGNFSKASPEVLKPFAKLGFINDADWVDVDGDKDLDLVVASEWNPVLFLINEKGKFTKLIPSEENGLSGSEGLWCEVEANDFDKDGDIDFVFGNLGLNSKLKASAGKPVRLYVNDFDKNGSIDQILTHYIDGKEYPFYTKDEMVKQLPYLKKQFLSYQKFAESTMQDIFKPEEIKQSEVFTANRLDHAFVENLGDGKFKLKSLPNGTQFSTMQAITSFDFNGDGTLDILAGGNFYPVNIQMGRYDASYGSLLLGKGKNQFNDIPPYRSGLMLDGEVRVLKQVVVNGKRVIIAGRNNSSLQVFGFEKSSR